jgi:soluble lytic murein transglycosylase
MTHPVLIRLVLALGLLFVLTPARADEATAMAAAQGHAAAGNWAEAAAAAQGAGEIGQAVILWQQLRAGVGLLGDYEAFIARHPDWPGLPLLREKGEAQLVQTSDPARIIAYFGSEAPRTGAGAVALVAALQAQGQVGAAETEAMRAWAQLKFRAEDETALLRLTPEMLDLTHDLRLDNILWDGGRIAEAERMLPRVSEDWRALARARMGLRADKDGVTALIAAVPEALKDDPGLACERFAYRMRRDNYPDAAALLLERSTDAASLGRPAVWAERRALLARLEMRQGAAQTAYAIASSHHLTGGSDYSDLEFLAGYIALRKLDDPDRALQHFIRLENAVATGISLARAHYWQGRAWEAKGNGAEAEAAYQRAARHQSAYYGQLAAERLGLTLDAALLADEPPAGDWRSAAFAQSSVLAAALLLADAGDRTLAKRFMLHLGESLDATGLAQLAEAALARGEPHIALLVGKAAAERGVILPRAYYPAPTFVPDDLAVSRALALSITRRESEFDPEAQSSAGARGLMQLMPGTAQKEAKELGLTYALSKLTEDPGFNVALGASYLAEMAAEFGPSIALIASGYNAGPGRPREWIRRFGDPRSADVDVVDWVESIPFAETRTYVMRVAESVVIYRARLKGVAGPVRISAELRG